MNTDKEISRNLQEVAKKVSGILDEITGVHMGFTLIVFNAEADSDLNYVSNCDRGEVIEVYKNLIKSWDEGMPDIPSHKKN